MWVGFDSLGDQRTVTRIAPRPRSLANEVVAGAVDRRPEQDRVPGRVAVEAAEPRQPEEPRHGQHGDAVDPHGPRIELEPVEPRLRPLERCARAQPVPGTGSATSAYVWS